MLANSWQEQFAQFCCGSMQFCCNAYAVKIMITTLLKPHLLCLKIFSFVIATPENEYSSHENASENALLKMLAIAVKMFIESRHPLWSFYSLTVCEPR